MTAIAIPVAVSAKCFDDGQLKIMPNHSISFELPGTDSLYAVSSVNGMQVAVLTTNLEDGS